MLFVGKVNDRTKNLFHVSLDSFRTEGNILIALRVYTHKDNHKEDSISSKSFDLRSKCHKATNWAMIPTEILSYFLKWIHYLTKTSTLSLLIWSCRASKLIKNTEHAKIHNIRMIMSRLHDLSLFTSFVDYRVTFAMRVSLAFESKSTSNCSGEEELFFVRFRK